MTFPTTSSLQSDRRKLFLLPVPLNDLYLTVRSSVLIGIVLPLVGNLNVGATKALSTLYPFPWIVAVCLVASHDSIILQQSSAPMVLALFTHGNLTNPSSPVSSTCFKNFSSFSNLLKKRFSFLGNLTRNFDGIDAHSLTLSFTTTAEEIAVPSNFVFGLVALGLAGATGASVLPFPIRSSGCSASVRMTVSGSSVSILDCFAS